MSELFLAGLLVLVELLFLFDVCSLFKGKIFFDNVQPHLKYAYIQDYKLNSDF